MKAIIELTPALVGDYFFLGMEWNILAVRSYRRTVHQYLGQSAWAPCRSSVEKIILIETVGLANARVVVVVPS